MPFLGPFLGHLRKCPWTNAWNVQHPAEIPVPLTSRGGVESPWRRQLAEPLRHRSAVRGTTGIPGHWAAPAAAARELDDSGWYMLNETAIHDGSNMLGIAWYMVVVYGSDGLIG